jgi:hypothetical protein
VARGRRLVRGAECTVLCIVLACCYTVNYGAMALSRVLVKCWLLLVVFCMNACNVLVMVVVWWWYTYWRGPLGRSAGVEL